MSSQHAVAGHQLSLLCCGAEYFPALLSALQSAQHSVYLEAYIFEADETGYLFKEVLKKAAGRGVSVHLLLDGFGAAEIPPVWVEEMRGAGVQVLWFRQEVARLSFRRQRLRRLHRKLVLVDDVTAFVGGINIIDDAVDEKGSVRWDFAVEVRGPVVAQISHSMHKLWQLVSWINFRKSGDRISRLPRQKLSQQPVMFLIRDNLRHRHNIELAYLHAITHARHEIVIANAYFLPGHRFRKALREAIQRGVRVVLLLQGKVDIYLMHYATLGLYEELLRAGIEIYECTRNLLHAKVAVIDQHWTTVGSSNFDPFSLWLAREANLVVQDKDFAAALRENIMHEMQQGTRRVATTDWQQQRIWLRLLSRGSYTLVKLLAGMTGYARNNDNI